MHSEWDEYSGNELSIEVALDARGAAREIEQLRRYRAAYIEACKRINARRDFIALLQSNADASPAPDRQPVQERFTKLGAEIDGLEIALNHLEASLAEAMEP